MSATPVRPGLLLLTAAAVGGAPGMAAAAAGGPGPIGQVPLAGDTLPTGRIPLSADTLPLITLDAWAEGVWLDLLDREGTLDGSLSESGIFQRFHPRMDAEYSLDVHTGLFTAAEDAAWARSGQGLRAAASSISHPHLLTRVDWRQAFPVTGSLELTADYRRDHSLTDRRDHARLGVRWHDVGGSGWTAWSRIGVHFFKPAADLELGVTRAWRTGEDGGWHLELGLAALDAFSDLVFVGLGVDPDEVEAHLDHAGVPLAGRVAVHRRGRGWRLEVHGGATTSMLAEVTFPGTGSDRFDLLERARFAGALVEGRPAPGLTAAGWARVAVAETRRTHPPGVEQGLRLRERTEGVGGYARQRLSDALYAHAELHAIWRPETRIDPDGTLTHEDRELYGGVALVRRAAAGWTGRLGYAVLDRDAGVLLPDVAGRHHRLVTEGGYRTVAGFQVTAGLRWDLDQFGDHVFDGAHLRLSALP